MLNLIPEKYHGFYNKFKYQKELKEAYYSFVINLKRKGYEILEIVPLCLEEFVTMTSRDVIVTNLEKSDYCGSYIYLGNVYEIMHFKRIDQKDNNCGYSLQTKSFGTVYDYYTLQEYDEGRGFQVIDNKYSRPIHLTHFSSIDADEYCCYEYIWVFKLKAPDSKKIRVDKTAFKYLESIIDKDNFEVLKSNFKVTNKEVTLLGFKNE